MKKEIKNIGKTAQPANIIGNVDTKFLRVEKSHFDLKVLNPTNPNCRGWLVRFDTNPNNQNQKIVFTEIENANGSTIAIYDLEIGNSPSSPCRFVDSNLNFTQNGSLHNLEVMSGDVDNFQIGKAAFFFVSKDELTSMYAPLNIYYFSLILLDYGPSAIYSENDSSNPDSDSYDPYAHSNTYPILKIEADQSSGVVTINVNSRPVQAKYIFGVPCPPQWKPAFSSIASVSVNGQSVALTEVHSTAQK